MCLLVCFFCFFLCISKQCKCLVTFCNINLSRNVLWMRLLSKEKQETIWHVQEPNLLHVQETNFNKTHDKHTRTCIARPHQLRRLTEQTKRRKSHYAAASSAFIVAGLKCTRRSRFNTRMFVGRMNTLARNWFKQHSVLSKPSRWYHQRFRKLKIAKLWLGAFMLILVESALWHTERTDQTFMRWSVILTFRFSALMPAASIVSRPRY